MTTTLNHSWVQTENEWNMLNSRDDLMGTVVEEPTGMFCVIKWSDWDNCEVDLGSYDNLTEAQFALYTECLADTQGWDRLAAEVFDARQDFPEPEKRMNVIQVIFWALVGGCVFDVAIIWGTYLLVTRMVTR